MVKYDLADPTSFDRIAGTIVREIAMLPTADGIAETGTKIAPMNGRDDFRGVAIKHCYSCFGRFAADFFDILLEVLQCN